MLHAGTPSRADWWPPAAGFALWAAAPVIAPWLVTRRRARWTGPALAAFLASTGFAAVAYVEAFFRSSSSTAGLALLFVPLWQWAIMAGVAALAAIATRLRR